MPTCPGCQQRVSHDRLDTHERYCHGLHGDESPGLRSMRRLEDRIDELDRRFDRRVRALEVSVGNRSTQDDSDEGGLKLLERDW